MTHIARSVLLEVVVVALVGVGSELALLLLGVLRLGTLRVAKR